MSTSMVQEVIERAKQKEFAEQNASIKPLRQEEPSIEQILRGAKIAGGDVRIVKIQNVDNENNDDNVDGDNDFPEDRNQTVGVTVAIEEEFDEDIDENMCIDDEPDDDPDDD